eukprot:GHVU01153442.1.p1 GENE.GHVU01153442.1~~GHVU01153442.1.p1  ORF type:complete len:128 (-),score=9.74 GHVU01153442.1:112-495(-)
MILSENGNWMLWASCPNANNFPLFSTKICPSMYMSTRSYTSFKTVSSTYTETCSSRREGSAVVATGRQQVAVRVSYGIAWALPDARRSIASGGLEDSRQTLLCEPPQQLDHAEGGCRRRCRSRCILE